MNKQIKYLGFILLSFMLLINTVFAADYSISLTSNSVTVGNTVTLRIDGSASGLTGRFNISSSNPSVASLGGSNVWIENNSQSITISAKSVGTSVITVTPTSGISDKNANEPTLNTKTITLTVNGKPAGNNNGGGNNYVARPKSSNNFLSSLSVEGLSLEEKFDKEKLEYSINIPAETEKIKINAQLADSTARVTGTGELKVSPGLNTFEIIVTAENGSKRTYVLKATLLELKPIEVTINNKNYTVVRKRKDLPKISDYYTEKEITLDTEKVEGYYNEKLNYELVGLKDSNGVVEYYKYKNNRYTLYKEYTFNGVTLEPSNKKIDNTYKKVTFNYDNNQIEAYQAIKPDILKNTYALDSDEVMGSKYYLFYATNIETGLTSLYQYDDTEKTVQRYNLELLDTYKGNNKTYYTYLLISLLTISILIIIIGILLVKLSKQKQNKIAKKKKLNKNTVDFDEEE